MGFDILTAFVCRQELEPAVFTQGLHVFDKSIGMDIPVLPGAPHVAQMLDHNLGGLRDEDPRPQELNERVRKQLRAQLGVVLLEDLHEQLPLLFCSLWIELPRPAREHEGDHLEHLFVLQKLLWGAQCGLHEVPDFFDKGLYAPVLVSG